VAHARAGAGALAGRALDLPIAGGARALRLSPTVVRAGLARADGLVAERSLALAELLRARARNPRCPRYVPHNGPLLLADDLTREGITYQDGHVFSPDDPGLGVTLDEAKLERYGQRG
jgi:muconate cycloisomerase